VSSIRKESIVVTRTLGSAFLALATLVAIACPVLAAPPRQVALELVRAADLSEIDWSATGAIVDAGSWSTERKQYDGSAHSDAFVVTEVLTTQVGANGTFHLRFQGLANRSHSFSGNWQLDGGTGAYAGLTGTGQWFETDDATTGELLFFLAGTVH
jgi:hypothetical protein